VSNTRQEVTLRHVASVAGVSTATVARVLRGRGYVSEQSRLKVEQAVAETGYRVNAVARALSAQRTMTIGYMLHELAPHTFFTEVALGAAEEAARRGYSIMLFNSQADAARETSGVNEMLERRVDGIIFGTSASTKNVESALDAGVAVVEVERPRSTRSGAILVRNRQATSLATRHLIDLGHRELGFIGSAPMNAEAGIRDAAVERDRLAGFIDAAQDAGLTIHDANIVLGDYFNYSDPSFPTGHDYMQQLLASPRRPTAVLVTSDVLAAGALRALRDAGMSVPNDMSIVAVDDDVAQFLLPALTVMRQPVTEMGIEAVRMVDAMVEAGVEAIEIPHEVHLEMTFIERESTARFH
jgi:LacI family transcriptional regulator, galactose operon repressor